MKAGLGSSSAPRRARMGSISTGSVMRSESFSSLNLAQGDEQSGITGEAKLQGR